MNPISRIGSPPPMPGTFDRASDPDRPGSGGALLEMIERQQEVQKLMRELGRMQARQALQSQSADDFEDEDEDEDVNPG